MAASKRRPLWDDLPAPARAQIEHMIASPVVTAQNCEGGYSPGFASLLTLADGRRAFVKAMDSDTWPSQALMHRAEASVAAALPNSIPAPRFLGSSGEGHWVALAFEGIDGTEPAQPWNLTDLDRVLAAIDQLARAGTLRPSSCRATTPGSADGPAWPATPPGAPGWPTARPGPPATCPCSSRSKTKAWQQHRGRRWCTSTCIPTTSC